MSFTFGEGEHRPSWGEEETVASTLGVIAHRLIGLALVGDKGERELPIGVEGLFLAHLRRRCWLGNWRRRSRLRVRICCRRVLRLRSFGDCDQGDEGEKGRQS